MMISIESTALQPYHRLTRTLAKRMMRSVRGNLDCVGCDFDDYQVMLMAHVWRTITRWRVYHEPDSNGERRYVCASLWNAVRDYERKRGSAYGQAAHVPYFEREHLDEQWQADIETRIWIDQMRTEATPQEWDALATFLIEGQFTAAQRTPRRRWKKIQLRLSKSLESDR